MAGGSGDDNIIAYGDIVGSVSGGDGDDQIVVGSRNVTFAEGWPKQSIPVVSGGAGNDVIAIAGKAEVEFAKGDGKDQIVVGDTTKILLSGFEQSELGITTNEDGTITIGGAATEDGSGDRITIESRTGTLKFIFDEAAGALTIFTSEEAFAAADNTTPETLFSDLKYVSTAVPSGDSPVEIAIDEPQFLKLEGDAALSAGATIEDAPDGTLLTLAERNRQVKLTSETGPLFVDVVSNRTLALFKTQEQLDAWNASPVNPANRSNPPADELMAVLERINQRFI